MTTLFAAMRRTSDLVGRTDEMKAIRDAIHPGDDSCQIVFIQGQGGFGKTRLLEETLWRLGNPSEREEHPMTQAHQERGLDWQDFSKVVATDIVDLIDTRLHARNHFLREVRENLRWAQEIAPEFNFNTYDAALAKHERRVLDSVEYRLTQEAAEEAIAAFWKDYEILTHTRRIVWVIDTAEQLSFMSSQWLIDQSLLADDQLYFQAQKWLAESIRKGRFRNTTLLFAGRDIEGEKFFDAIAKAAKDAGLVPCSIEAKPFDEKEIQEYFQMLAAEWRRLTGEGVSTPGSEAQPGQTHDEARTVAEAMQMLAESPDRMRVLHIYTGGQPVLLSMFADLIVESGSIPEALKITDAGTFSDEEKEMRQWRLEEEVVNLLFRQPRVPAASLSHDKAEEWLKQTTLRRDILQALVRARLGLTAEQLHFVIDNPRNLDPEAWEKEASTDRLRQIAKAVEGIRELSIVKNRPRLRVVQNGGGKYAPRLGLRDEVYRIFAEHMAPHIQLGKPLNDREVEERARLQRISAQWTEADLTRYRRNYEDEKRARERLYSSLKKWADYERRKVRDNLKEIQEGEERTLEMELYRVTPAAPRAAARLFDIKDEDQTKRITYRRALRELDLEFMHYAFSLDPDRELNNAYFDLADEFWRANDEDADVLTQAEMWRILHDPHAPKFVEWMPREEVTKRGEQIIDVVRRAAIQEDASRWIKRLALRREYASAIQFADALERYIASMPEGNDKRSWQHTFVRGERLCWRGFARILPGKGREIEAPIKDLEEIVGKLEQLAHCDTNTVAIPETGEKGFIGHPAHVRLQRVISVIFANIGYGYAQLGHFRKAVHCYSKALNYIRETGAKAHRATVLNNLSRALSEMGRQRALRICLDALGLRQQLGADAPIGLSHSTLALIYNDQNNPDRAWIEAAKALLFFQRVDDPRGRGLANIQLGEALRRLAAQSRYGRALPATKDELYHAAEDALNEALDIFLRAEPTNEEKAKGKVEEPLRWIEVRIEKGCLNRDRLSMPPPERNSREWQGFRSTALGLLKEAAIEASANGWLRLELDARVNIAWTYHYAGDLSEAERAIEGAQKLIGEITLHGPDLINPDQDPPTPDQFESYIYYQLSKLHGLRGRIAMERFNKWVEERSGQLETEIAGVSRQVLHAAIGVELKEDPHNLDKAVDAYILGIAYAQLYSPRSTALSALYDALYGYLKKFNRVELEAFHQLVRRHHLTERKAKMKPVPVLTLEDLGDLDEFLHESLGVLPHEWQNGIDSGHSR